MDTHRTSAVRCRTAPPRRVLWDVRRAPPPHASRTPPTVETVVAFDSVSSLGSVASPPVLQRRVIEYYGECSETSRSPTPVPSTPLAPPACGEHVYAPLSDGDPRVQCAICAARVRRFVGGTFYGCRAAACPMVLCGACLDRNRVALSPAAVSAVPPSPRLRPLVSPTARTPPKFPQLPQPSQLRQLSRQMVPPKLVTQGRGAVRPTTPGQEDGAPGPVRVGGVVVRNAKHWKWGDQDGGEGKTGVVLSVVNGWVKVRWGATGRVGTYRHGFMGGYDVAAREGGGERGSLFSPLSERRASSESASDAQVCADMAAVDGERGDAGVPSSVALGPPANERRASGRARAGSGGTCLVTVRSGGTRAMREIACDARLSKIAGALPGAGILMWKDTVLDPERAPCSYGMAAEAEELLMFVPEQFVGEGQRHLVFRPYAEEPQGVTDEPAQSEPAAELDAPADARACGGEMCDGASDTSIPPPPPSDTDEEQHDSPGMDHTARSSPADARHGESPMDGGGDDACSASECIAPADSIDGCCAHAASATSREDGPLSVADGGGDTADAAVRVSGVQLPPCDDASGSGDLISCGSSEDAPVPPADPLPRGAAESAPGGLVSADNDYLEATAEGDLATGVVSVNMQSRSSSDVVTPCVPRLHGAMPNSLRLHSISPHQSCGDSDTADLQLAVHKLGGGLDAEDDAELESEGSPPASAPPPHSPGITTPLSLSVRSLAACESPPRTSVPSQRHLDDLRDDDAANLIPMHEPTAPAKAQERSRSTRPVFL